MSVEWSQWFEGLPQLRPPRDSRVKQKKMVKKEGGGWGVGVGQASRNPAPPRKRLAANCIQAQGQGGHRVRFVWQGLGLG